ncbi:MAG: hypothetical protein KAH44_31955 [Oricola sp.]|jgi:hypothetical protein|nr:hypothetical protein [Oricola sp.]
MSTVFANLDDLQDEAEAVAADKARQPKTFWKNVEALVGMGLFQFAKPRPAPRKRVKTGDYIVAGKQSYSLSPRRTLLKKSAAKETG